MPPTVDLGIAGWRVPAHSHIACLWETEQGFAEAVGFVETGLEGSDPDYRFCYEVRRDPNLRYSDSHLHFDTHVVRR